ncbi:uncharacterized protein [Nicotiana tomentosiformis]|uniref:uncharacterized protein n=1 Tax=Nicotiana tomentosiformis TaxID=4098 RepID=UPI00388C6605
MENSKTIDILIVTATRLDMDESGSPVNETMYRGLYARFQSSPKESHLKVAKRILRYLKGIHDMFLYYPSGDNFDLIGYADVDYTGYLVDRKSISDMVNTHGNYRENKQPITLHLGKRMRLTFTKLSQGTWFL